MKYLGLLLAVPLLAWNLPADGTQAAEVVQIVYGKNAPSLEQMAAREFAEQLPRIFADVEVTVSDKAPDGAGTTILVGTPQTNPGIAKLFTNWPKVSDQGLVIKSLPEKKTYAVGGGSPAACLWAVCEWGHRLGVRYVPRGDMFPNELKPFDLGSIDVTLEPQLRTRTWRTINDFAIGPESWGLEEHRPFLKQLAKMKFNRLMLSVYPWQPFVEYEFAGVKKTTATHWFGETFPVDGDTVGKKVFRGEEVFENPDFAGLTTSQERHAAGKRHMQGLIDAAHELGMTVGVSISPLEFPLEFQKALPGSRVAKQLKSLTITPGPEQGPTDAVLKQLVSAKIRAYLKTYPQLDTLYLTMPEFPEWDQHTEAALALLKQRGAPADLTVENLLKSVAHRKTIASGKRGEQALKGNVVGLAFFSELFQDKSLLKRGDGESVALVITSVDPALYPVLEQVLPAGASALHFIDYTARRVAENRDLLAQVPADRVPSQLIMTLADDNVGVLPQSALQSLGTLMTDIKQQGWDGFSTRYWVPAELDPGVYFLSRSAWEKDLTAEAGFKDLWGTATGNEAATERLWLAWQHLEQATNLIDEHELGFTFPVQGMLMKHYRADPLPEWWETINTAYTQYMIELYRAHGAISGDAKPLLFYYAKRGEYVLEYLAAVKAVREAALAKKSGDNEAAMEHLETALEQTYNSINTLADVARDQSDRGVIAVLNEYAFRPLLAEVERLSEAE